MLRRLKEAKVWRAVVQTVLLVSVVGFAVSLYQQRDMIAGPVPNIETVLVSGELFDLGDALADGPVLIYFWGSWCPICAIVSPAVSELSKEHNVLSVALSSGSDAEIAAYQEQHHYRFATLNDQQGLYGERWGVVVTPSFFIVNQRGEISYVSSGPTSRWGLQLRLWLASLER
ncbi:peroxiredoxin [Sinobacterium caligoides]|uniref:Peroxiredoxin n=1 Tax=Sinobacterium caligoides TaxID=933926 RepID=A0A3N2DHM0_9GAMM|nr:protein disulfide oxidoreductase [Sinobacterium caligoides]ROR98884.1 peroxiredoxin [Sinobacterium caligoides]